MSDSLIPVGRLIEARFMVNHRIPSQANEDGFSLKAFPLYGGTITTPDGKTVNCHGIRPAHMASCPVI